jgi:hypothetical protein
MSMLCLRTLGHPQARAPPIASIGRCTHVNIRIYGQQAERNTYTGKEERHNVAF